MNILEKSVRALPTQGKTFNEEVLGFYKRNGASSSVLPDAEKQYLAKAVAGAYVSNQDGWKELEGRFGVGGFNSIYAVRKNGGSCWPIMDSLGLVYGPELIAQPITPAAWDVGTDSLSLVGNEMLFTASAVVGRCRYGIATTPGKTYTFNWYGRKGTISSLKYSVWNGTGSADIIPITSYQDGFNSVSFVAPAGCTQAFVYYIRDAGSTGTAYFSGASVREVISASLYQDTAGTLPVTTQGQVIGLSLDQSYGSANLGSELLPSGTAGASIGVPGTLPTGWQGGVTVNGVSRQVVAVAADYIDLRLTGTSTSTWADFLGVIGTTVSVTPGQTLKFSLNPSSVVAGAMPSGGSISYGAVFQLNGTFVSQVALQNGIATVPAGVNQLRLFNSIANYGNGVAVDVTIRVPSSASVKEVLGVHLTQSTGANKPTLTRVPKKLGPELAVGGDGTTLAGWTTSTWAVSGGKFVCQGVGDLAQNVLVAAKTYLATWDSDNTNTVNVRAGSQYNSHLQVVGRNARLITPDGALFGFQSGVGPVIDNISVREVLEWSNAYQFDGSNDTLTFTPPAITTAATLGWAGTISDLSGNRGLLGSAQSWLYISNDGRVQFTPNGGGQGIGTASGSVSANTPVVITAKINIGGTSEFRVNGVLIYSTTALTVAMSGANWFVNSLNASFFTPGTVSDVMIENSVIPLADLKAWERNACNQLGIAYAG